MSGRRIDLSSTISRTAPRAGWFIALGIAFVLLGVLAWADVVATTLASTVLIGLLLLLAGIVQLVHAAAHHGPGPRAGRRTGVWLPALIGLLYLLGGLSILREPVTGSVLLTAFLAGCLIFAGLARAVWAAGHRQLAGWWSLLLSGLVALGIGILVYVSLPWSGLWLLGTVGAVELIVGGVAALTFGLSLRRRELGLGAGGLGV